MEKIKKMSQLVDTLNRASEAYYNSTELLMSDKEFDGLFDELRQLEKNTGTILANSPTQNVGYEVKSSLEKVQHDIPLLSLGKTKSIDDLKKFMKDKECALMWKGDGLTNEIVYNDGKLIQGSTRGNGFVGEAITHNIKTYNRLPLTIAFKGYLKLSGEAVIFDEDFEEINRQENQKYKNSRNLVAGSVRQLDSKICAKRKVHFMAFNILEAKIDDEDIEFKNFVSELNFLEKLGFYVIGNCVIKNTDELEKRIDDMRESAKKVGIPIDGMVLRYNDIDYGNSLGKTSHHPLHSIAYKFYNEEVETEYIKTEWSVSRTGQLNPVAIFKPVEIEGSEVRRATLHNVDYFEELQLGKDDIITVIKSNEVIPKVTGNITRSNTEKIPDSCPICEGKTEIKLLKTSRVLYCTNKDCPSKRIAQFEHFCSREAMNILGLGESIIEAFINKGFLKEIPDIYLLRRYEDEIIKLEGFGQKSYDNIINAIDTAKRCKFANFLFALGIPQIGKGSAKILAKYFNNSVVKFTKAIGLHFDFSQIKDIGITTNEEIHKWFSTKENKNMFIAILEHIDIEVEKEQGIKNNPFQGKTMVVTGTLKGYTRKSIQEKLVSLGIKNTSSVSKRTDYVLTGENPGANKYDKALELGITILTENKFEQMCKEG